MKSQNKGILEEPPTNVARDQILDPVAFPVRQTRGAA